MWYYVENCAMPRIKYVTEFVVQTYVRARKEWL
jgi:hypothetical protein